MGRDKCRSSNFVPIEKYVWVLAEAEGMRSAVAKSWPWLPYPVGHAEDSQDAQIQKSANLQKAFWAELTS
jgi:hypothetical protein